MSQFDFQMYEYTAIREILQGRIARMGLCSKPAFLFLPQPTDLFKLKRDKCTAHNFAQAS